MSIPISLIQMPNLVMGHIFEYLEFPSILVLRKVCHDLRNFIDDTKPASHLTKISINSYVEYIQFCLESKTGAQNEIHIFYQKCIEGCMVKKYNKNAEIMRTTLENEDFITVFCKDFDIILKHQKTVLEEFRINFNSSTPKVRGRILESVNKSLKSMSPPFKVKLLEMGVTTHEDIMSILPYIDSKSVEAMQITDSLSNFKLLNLNEIGQLEQWKQAKQLIIRGFQIPDLAQNLKHFSRITIYFQPVSPDFIILLEEIFLCSSTLTTIEIYYNCDCSGHISPRFIDRFGEPFVGTYYDKNWFFRIPNTNEFLRIKINSVDIHFNRIELSDVPQNVRILN